jgi:hypothetical protein
LIEERFSLWQEFMKKIFLVLIVLLFSACSEISGSGGNYPLLGTSLGDLQRAVLKRLGEPDEKKSSIDRQIEAWTYSKKFTEIDDISLQYKIIFVQKNNDSVVSDIYCSVENYEIAVGLYQQANNSETYNDEKLCKLHGVGLFSRSDALVKKFGEPNIKLSVNNSRKNFSAVAFVYDQFIVHVFKERIVEIYYGEHFVEGATSTHIYPFYWY